MKNIKSFLAKAALAVITTVFFVACEDDLYSKELLVFMRNWSESSYNIKKSYSKDGSLTINGQTELKFPLYLTRESVVDVSVGVVMDETLVGVYNATNNTAYNALPKEAVKVSDNITISAGTLRSADSISVLFNYEKIKPGTYLVPIKIGNVESADKGIQGSSSINAGVLYYQFSVELDNIDNLDFEPLKGEKVDRANWKITCDDEPNVNAPVTNLIDGDRKTDYIGTKKVFGTILVDMGQEHNLKGFTFYHTGTYFGSPTKFQVYASSDGEEWVDYGLAGKYIFSITIQDIEYGINFFVPVSCRYFKLQLKEVYLSSVYPVRFSELDAIK
ncbi:MAG: DUF1735 domain-containing protein [Bacteroides sp.]|uniref:BT_3987 domain-containing protein n=1 Tax=Bacteroides sp. TaxID=29523 RepID=UPI002FCA930D